MPRARRIPALLLTLALASPSGACARDEPERPSPARNRVVLLALDGAALPIVRELASAGRLPAFRQLLQRGSVGRLASLYRELPHSPERGGGYWSPIVWNSIATGKTPEVHGVVDFRLPDPTSVRLCTKSGVREARIRIPLQDAAAVRLSVDGESDPAGWRARLGCDEAQGLAVAPGLLDVALPDGPDGEIDLVLRAETDDAGPLCLQAVFLLDHDGLLGGSMHFVTDRDRFSAGWNDPRLGTLVHAGPQHRMVRALWNIAGDAGRRVAVVSWRDSWPAEEVQGYFVSDRLGLRVASRPDRVRVEPRQYHPATLGPRAAELVARLSEIDTLADRTLLADEHCKPSSPEVARMTYSRDWLAHEMATGLWDGDPTIDFLAVYYRGIDSFGHMYQADRQPREGRCHITPPLVDRYYGLVDGFVADWVSRLGRDTTLVIVADHGMQAGETVGEHADNGLVLLAGRGIRTGRLRDMDVLDVAPLVLYLLDLPLAADMPGEPPWYAIDPALLAGRPPARIPTHETAWSRPAFVKDAVEIEAELTQRLRALGYID